MSKKRYKVPSVGVDSRLFGRNVEQIRFQATRVIVGRVPAEVRKELNAAVRAGWLGHLKKDGLKPEIYFHPDHLHGAIERQNREAAYAVASIAKVFVPASDLTEADLMAMVGEVAKPK